MATHFILSSNDDIELLTTYHQRYIQYTENCFEKYPFPIISKEIQRIIPNYNNLKNIEKLEKVVNILDCEIIF